MAQAHAGEEDQDRLFHGRGRAGNPCCAGPGSREDPCPSQAFEAEVHVRGRAAPAGQREDRPPPYALRADRSGHRPACQQGPQPPEHPDPGGGRAAHPGRFRARPRDALRERRLRADRARHPGVPLQGPHPPPGVPGGKGHPSTDRLPHLRSARRPRSPRTIAGSARRSTSGSSTGCPRSGWPRA